MREGVRCLGARAVVEHGRSSQRLSWMLRRSLLAYLSGRHAAAAAQRSTPRHHRTNAPSNRTPRSSSMVRLTSSLRSSGRRVRARLATRARSPACFHPISARSYAPRRHLMAGRQRGPAAAPSTSRRGVPFSSPRTGAMQHPGATSNVAGGRDALPVAVPRAWHSKILVATIRWAATSHPSRTSRRRPFTPSTDSRANSRRTMLLRRCAKPAGLQFVTNDDTRA